MKKNFRIPKNEINGKYREILGYYGNHPELVANAEDDSVDFDSEEYDMEEGDAD